jgi:dipeptidyl aminopeptidase/acylaminoacyl peptidase
MIELVRPHPAGRLRERSAADSDDASPSRPAGCGRTTEEITMKRRISTLQKIFLTAGLLAITLATDAQTPSAGLQSRDLYQLRSVGDVQFSPDGSRIAYSVTNNDRPGSPYSQLWLMDTASGKTTQVEGASGGARWSPDGRWIASFGRVGEQFGLIVIRADGSQPTFIASVQNTNHPLPSTGERLAWSPDGKQIAFISATPGPETEAASGDPVIITRYLYKPTASEGMTRFNDNRRTHIFIAGIETKQVRQLTDGHYYEHSIDWSPSGDELLFVSNREPDPDRFFNYDVFAIKPSDGKVRQLTRTENVEYRPRWSPAGKTIVYLGTKRGLTSSETTMEDTHVWTMNADGSNRREISGAIDNRQGAPEWSEDGSAIYFTVQERGNVRLYRLPVNSSKPEVVINDRGSVGSWSVARNGSVAYSFAAPRDPAQLYLRAHGAAKPLTNLNQAMLGSRQIAEVEAFTFQSFDGLEIEAFLTKPLGMTANSKHPMITVIHGGPHGQQGLSFNSKAQVYAARGWAVLMVNYRGSTGYGQKFADAIFRDQNGGEAKDVLYGVEAALRRNGWIDGERLGVEGVSYGGQLTNWLITQTNRFRAAIPIAGISNLITQNYLAYYHDYLAVEFGAFPHQEGLMDVLWQRSPIRYVGNVKTPVMLVHGENDNDVPIAEAEQFYIALKDVGVETVMIRYPREGHGVRENRHVVDLIDRSVAWYEKHFRNGSATSGATSH